jgi:hypothetical protein
MNGRTCFFTNSRHFGMGLDSVRDGDVLVNIPGSLSLIALRPKEDDLRNSNHTVPKMTVVGDCYVHGLPTQQQQDHNALSEYRIV